ncbi:MAG: hypothetical protein JEZ12_01095 [Desulfobacterium sp.]|nr:hypothetical protein [Desulfobacterium sp.]
MLQSDAEDILEKYIRGKDKDRFEILEEIYESGAKVTFEINSDAISFPGEIVGNREIAKVLSSDSNKNYDHVKTYCLSREFPLLAEGTILKQKWLVLMREKTSHLIRVGSGSYGWHFRTAPGSHTRIKHHHIYIHDMLTLSDWSLRSLLDLQMRFSYPWLEQEKAIKVLNEYRALNVITDYLKTNEFIK